LNKWYKTNIYNKDRENLYSKDLSKNK